MLNLVKLFTHYDESVHVDTTQLSRRKTHLTIYTARGNRLSDVGKTKEIRESASWGIHFKSLFASKELADADSDATSRKIFGDSALTSAQLREQRII